MPRRSHILITGTGRAGTTFLVELLTHLQLDTGFTTEELAHFKDSRSRAGLEHDIREDTCPYVVKSPHFCDIAEEVLQRDDIEIEHVLIPIRDLHAAAESRRHVRAAVISEESLLRRVARTVRPRIDRGGLWHTTKGHEQEIILLQQFYNLTLALAGTTIPVTLLRFPRLVNDPSYLFTKLRPILSDVGEDQFNAAFETVANPSLVHSFGSNDQ